MQTSDLERESRCAACDVGRRFVRLGDAPRLVRAMKTPPSLSGQGLVTNAACSRGVRKAENGLE